MASTAPPKLCSSSHIITGWQCMRPKRCPRSPDQKSLPEEDKEGILYRKADTPLWCFSHREEEEEEAEAGEGEEA